MSRNDIPLSDLALIQLRDRDARLHWQPDGTVEHVHPVPKFVFTREAPTAEETAIHILLAILDGKAGESVS